jgi:hypothetical protein
LLIFCSFSHISPLVPVWPARPAWATVSAADLTTKLEKLEKTLQSDPSFQVRVQAAAVLGKLGDREAVPILIQTMMEDKHEMVRATCAEALGRLGDPAAKPALKAALSDPSTAVRAQAEQALKGLSGEHPAVAAPAAADPPGKDERRIPVTLGRMGSKARGITPDLPRRLKEAIARELASTPDVQVMDELRDHSKSGFTVESSVTEMSRRTMPGGQIEVTCEVSMVIGILPSHAIVGMTSGGATIQAPLRVARPSKAVAESLEADALTHAVRGAHQNLLAFLRNQK